MDALHHAPAESLQPSDSGRAYSCVHSWQPLPSPSPRPLTARCVSETGRGDGQGDRGGGVRGLLRDERLGHRRLGQVALRCDCTRDTQGAEQLQGRRPGVSGAVSEYTCDIAVFRYGRVCIGCCRVLPICDCWCATPSALRHRAQGCDIDGLGTDRLDRSENVLCRCEQIAMCRKRSLGHLQLRM